MQRRCNDARLDPAVAYWTLRRELPENVDVPFNGDRAALLDRALELALYSPVAWPHRTDGAVLETWAAGVAAAARRIWGRSRRGQTLREVVGFVARIASEARTVPTGGDR